MKISYNWLKRYVNINLDYKKVSEILTSIGLEVDSAEPFQQVKGGLEGLVVGEVVTCAKHPNADSLSVTTVNIGTGTVLPIVCGAPNVAAGQKVIVAPVGTTLYKGEEEFKIKKAKIRGEVSEGMICAEDEIGLGTSHEGVMVLKPDTKIGITAKEYFNISDDVIFEISITPNRIDSASHYGIARDLAAYLKIEKLVSNQSIDGLPDFERVSVAHFNSDSNSAIIPVTIENEEACPRYTGVTISGVTIKESPDWLKNSLKAIGQRPINNVVDITNYVLHETGQPLHAFDAEQITGKKVIVRTLPEGFPFITLDNVERKLSASDLMICNTEEGMCIAGVFGGAKSGVSENTKNIFLESAYFNPSFIRRTSKRHALQTDSSFHFERGVDPNTVIYALKRAALLIKELAGGEISSEIVDIYPKPIEDFRINLRYSNVDRLIGKIIDRELIKSIIQILEIKIVSETEAGLLLDVPPYRVDVHKEADVIEEILRFYGYNNVEIGENVNSTLSYIQKPDTNKVKNSIADYLSSNGFNETMSNSLTKSSYYDNSEEFKAANTVKIINPLSSDLNSLRQTLLFGGLESVINNNNHKNSNLRLYEFGNCYFFANEIESSNRLDKYSEEEHLALFISGNKQLANWNLKEQPTDFYFLKSYSENILQRLGFNLDLLKLQEVNNGVFQFALNYKLQNADLVTFGSLNKKLLKQFDIDGEVFYADFNWTSILKNIPVRPKYKELPKFPEVKRDLALLLDKIITFKQIKDIAFKVEKKLLTNVALFDIYQDVQKLGSDKKSYAITFTLRDEEKTLTDVQIDKIINSFITEFEKQLNAKIR